MAAQSRLENGLEDDLGLVGLKYKIYNRIYTFHFFHGLARAHYSYYLSVTLDIVTAKLC